jgi:hypothetical protein
MVYDNIAIIYDIQSCEFPLRGFNRPAPPRIFHGWLCFVPDREGGMSFGE